MDYMNTCIYTGLQPFTYVPKNKESKLPETVQEFKELVWSKSKDHLDKYPKWFQKEFMDYWLTVPDSKDKCRYFLLPKKEREKWSTLGRMATVKRTIYSKDPRWNQPEQKPSNIYPGKYQLGGRSNETRQLNEIFKR